MKSLSTNAIGVSEYDKTLLKYVVRCVTWDGHVEQYMFDAEDALHAIEQLTDVLGGTGRPRNDISIESFAEWTGLDMDSPDISKAYEDWRAESDETIMLPAWWTDNQGRYV